MPEGTAPLRLTLARASRPAPRRAPPNRRLAAGGVLSLLLHAALLAAVIFGLAHQARLSDVDTPAIVELVMSPPGGAHDRPASGPVSGRQPTAATPQPPTPAATPAQSEPKPLTPAATPAQPAPKPPTPEASAPPAAPQPPPPAAPVQSAAAALPLPPEPAPPPPASAPPPPAVAPPRAAPAPLPQPAEPPRPAAAAPRPEPPRPAPAAPPSPAPPARAAEAAAPPQVRKAPEFSLGTIASDTNALVTGDMVVPPSVDQKYHNRKPSYPPEAARRGEHGAVVLLIHVTPDGLVSGVDIASSSGYRLLDHAARDAVLTWHFLPAVKNGQPVPFSMPLRIVYDLN